MSYIKQIDVKDASGKLGSIYDAAKKRAGGVANIIKIMSLDATVCGSSMGLYSSIMKSENVLDHSTRELLATVVSNVNDCYY